LVKVTLMGRVRVGEAEGLGLGAGAAVYGAAYISTAGVAETEALRPEGRLERLPVLLSWVLVVLAAAADGKPSIVAVIRAPVVLETSPIKVTDEAATPAAAAIEAAIAAF